MKDGLCPPECDPQPFSSMVGSPLAKEAPQIFWPERGALLKAKTRSEDEKSGAKPTPAKTDCSITNGIYRSRMEWIAILALIGLITGLLAGLLGIGGGVITVPALYYFLSYFGFPKEAVMHVSIATALASTLITSSGSTWSHQKKGATLFPAFKLLAPGLFFGCIGGAIAAHFLSSDLLKGIFGMMVIGLGLFFFFPHFLHLRFADKPNNSLILWGLVVGSLSTLLGVGGGTFMVPILLGYAISLQNTVATSSAGTLITALFGTVLYLLIGWDHVHFPYVIGYIYLPGFFAIGLCSLFTTAWGVKLSHTLPTPLIKRVFGCALVATGLAMLLGS